MEMTFFHDLRTMLALISYGTETELIGDHLSRDQLIKIIRQAHASSRMAIDLVDAHLLLKRKETYDLRDVVVRTADAISTDPERSVLTAVPDLPIRTYEDPEPLMRILLNIAANAHQATRDGGSVVIGIWMGRTTPRTGKLDVGVYPDPPSVTLTVTDTGHGVEEALKSRIWEEGFTTKPDEAGGLGLPLVRHLVEEAGAGLSFRSTPGEGTTVRIYWPLTRAA
jgi:signal transduction histidine kinase